MTIEVRHGENEKRGETIPPVSRLENDEQGTERSVQEIPEGSRDKTSPDAGGMNLLEKSPEVGYLEVEITKDGLRMNLSGDAREFLKFLRENGVELSEPEVEWCG